MGLSLLLVLHLAGFHARCAQASLDDASALAAAVLSADAAELQGVLQDAWTAFERARGAWNLPAAEILIVAMHERAQADWSAMSLALLSTRMGEHERADRVLAQQIEREPDSLELLQRRAIAALGAGRRSLALDLLGEALARGGTDAYQILGRMALAEGRLPRARTLFRALLPTRIEAEEPLDAAPWALRGWGLALLP